MLDRLRLGYKWCHCDFIKNYLLRWYVRTLEMWENCNWGRVLVGSMICIL
jgi:hypothetical protein